MTEEELDKVATIFTEADGGCCVCVQEQFDSAKELLPDYDWDAARKRVEPNWDGERV